MRLSYERGTRLPINAGASALALLAWLPEDEVRELLSRTPWRGFTKNTLTDVNDLVKRPADIKKDGYSVTLAEVDDDAVGVAAPVFSETGEVTAALSIVASRRRVNRDRLKKAVVAVRAAADELTAKAAVMGFWGQSTG